MDEAALDEAAVQTKPTDRGGLAAGCLEIELEARPKWPCRPVFIGDRQRSSTVTSVQFLSETLMACGSFDGRRLDLVEMDGHEKLVLVDSVVGTYAGEPVQNDLLAASSTGELVATSNFHSGTSTLYRHDGKRITHARDLPFKVGGFVHGVRFYTDQVIALTACNGPSGVHFFDVDSGDRLLQVDIPRKCQDVAFLTPQRMIVVSVLGAPKFEPDAIYDSELQIFDFDIRTGTTTHVKAQRFEKAHFDACVIVDRVAYITDQYNNDVVAIDTETLAPLRRFGGFDFPHGLDIKFGLMAVTNYGSSTLVVSPFEAAR